MTAAASTAVAVTFVWLGMVLAISFLEAPLKFRAPGVTLAVGVGIGRLVFRALNTVEAVLAAAWLVAVIAGPVTTGARTAGAIAVGVLIVQVAAVRPALSRRSNRVLAGESAPRSRSHYAYVATEVVKVAALVTGGILLMSA
ncbi:hypothetical protein [Actinoplanes sp. NPDC051411]|jgi:hypothetical protein|uniref:hypothetical protein n=1 Tax=Actinoplanes sp. NPDC051411 TaxID=3155522 RepID=UPI0034324AA5